jgi:hypothetical protein
MTKGASGDRAVLDISSILQDNSDNAAGRQLADFREKATLVYEKRRKNL